MRVGREPQMTEVIINNKTMDRFDLLTEEARPIIESLNALIRNLSAQGLFMTSWYGNLPDGIGLTKENVKRVIKKTLGRAVEDRLHVGLDNRGPDYQPLQDSADDGRIPWYTYWQIFWVMTYGPSLRPGMRLLDVGGASSLFPCHAASMGYEIHVIDVNKSVVMNGKRMARAMGWPMFSYTMNAMKLDFKDGFFDHAYTLDVFQSLDYETKQRALAEIARCLKPKGILSVTFDYRNPAPPKYPCGFDTSENYRLQNEADIQRQFLSSGDFILLGNQSFYDNGKSYLVHPDFGNAPYTFGVIFLQKKS